MFLNILPTLLTMLIMISAVLYLVPTSTIGDLLGARSGPLGFLIAGLTGAIAMIPPFVAFPLGKILFSQQIPASTVAVFLTTLMMVGIVTLPLEIKFFGFKAAIMRNLLSFLGALLVGLLIGIFI